jgi:hypothetical protein
MIKITDATGATFYTQMIKVDGVDINFLDNDSDEMVQLPWKFVVKITVEPLAL